MLDALDFLQSAVRLPRRVALVRRGRWGVVDLVKQLDVALAGVAEQLFAAGVSVERQPAERQNAYLRNASLGEQDVLSAD